MTERHRMTIDGVAVSVSQCFDVINPTTGKVFAQAPECDAATCGTAIAAADRVFPEWSAATQQQRRQCLTECGALVHAHADELAMLLSQEMGKPITDSTQEAHIAGFLLENTSSLSLAPTILSESPRVEIHQRPHGVVAAIAPWNWPLGLAMWKVAPALWAGNTVVLKPSPYAPLSTLRLVELLTAALPPGVLNVVSGHQQLGQQLASSPLVRKIGFTGSVEGGRAIARAASENFTRLTLELGGNDPAFVLADADVDAIAEDIFWGAFANSGQVCGAIKRLYVARPIYQELVDALVACATTACVGDPLKPETQLGPIGNHRQYQRIQGLIAEARTAGASILCGSDQGPGYFHTPTIVTGAPCQGRLVSEEQFGPVLPILPFDNIQDALRQSNTSEYGLGGSVWSADVEHATKLAMQIECGTSWVNQHFAIHPAAPFGGRKHSGIGCENGLPGLHEYTEAQVLNVADSQS